MLCERRKFVHEGMLYFSALRCNLCEAIADKDNCCVWKEVLLRPLVRECRFCGTLSEVRASDKVS